MRVFKSYIYLWVSSNEEAAAGVILGSHPYPRIPLPLASHAASNASQYSAPESLPEGRRHIGKRIDLGAKQT